MNEDLHICAGSTVAGISTDAIENAIKTAHDESDNFTFIDGVKASEQLRALTERIATLEQQIQQAERKGYELCKTACTGSAYIDEEAIPSYQQAVAERDGGAK